MTTTQVVADPRWIRGVKDLYPSKNMDASLKWGTLDGDKFNQASKGTMLAGMVVTMGANGQVEKAISTLNGGRFRGIIFNESSLDLDESLGGNRPAIIRGDATVKLFDKVLDPDTTYTVGMFLKAASTAPKAGRLVAATVTGGTPDAQAAVVGVVQEVAADYIVVTMFPNTI